MKKKEIVEKTYELIFVEKRDVNFRMIAQELGISLGSINYHFKSKQNLLVEVCKLYVFNEINHYDNKNLIDLIYNINLGIERIKDNKKLALEIAYIIQSNVLPNLVDNVTTIFQTEYPHITKEKTVSIIITLQNIVINEELNASVYQVDFNNKKEIKKLVDLLV